MSEDSANRAPPDFADLVYDLVRQIPESQVCTYGQIAELLGYPRHARLVGTSLKVSNIRRQFIGCIRAIDGHDGEWVRGIY